MEIKVGDKVRVSKDATKLLFTRSICNYPEYVFEVRAIEEELADIYYGAGKIPLAAFVIPTKFLIKVEDEAKEPKFNVGDKVVVHYSTGDKMGRIQEVLYDGCYDVDYGGGCTGHHIIESRLYPYTEPTAPTIKVGDFVRVLENPHAPLLLRHGKTLGKYHTYEVTVDTVAMDWQRYEADLAKEIAVKLSDPNENKPGYVADYAVSVAKAVVENLKKK